MSGLEIAGVRKRFGTTEVLKGIDLAAQPGEFLSLVGPSGCGKTTLLRIVAGLERADEGEIVLDGRQVLQRRAADRDVAMVFQSYALYPHLDVLSNIAVPLLMRELTTLQRLPLAGRLLPGTRDKLAEIEARSRRTAETLGVGHLLDRKPGQLSGGQRQRVALGRAIIRSPRAFLMDEPLSNLDAALRVQMRQEIVDLHRRVGVITLYVTHDQTEAMTMSDRVALMMEGEVIQLGPPRELYEDPADARVAAFIGSPRINLLRLQDEAPWAQALRAALDLPGAAVQVGIRPEHLRAAGEGGRARGGAGGDLRLDCRFLRGEFLGAECFGYFRLEPDGQPVTARLGPDALSGVAPGEPLDLTIAPDDLFFFDADGRRLRFRAAAGRAGAGREAAPAVRAYG